MASRRKIKDSDDEELGEDVENERDGDEVEDEVDEEEEERASRRKARAARAAGRSRWQRVKARFRDVRVYLYFAFFVGSTGLAFLGTLSVWAPGFLGNGLRGWFKSIGSYNSYLFLLGILCIFTSAYLYLGLHFKRAEFKRLVSTKSKGDFVHSLDRIERLAFELGSHENDVVADRKRDFKIRH